MVTDIVRAYIAGFFDGEGCVSFQAYYKKGKYEKYPRIEMQVNITQVNRKVLEMIQEIYGGQISKAYKSNNKHKDCYKLYIVGKFPIKNFLESIKDFSIVKKDDINLGIEFAETIRNENLGCTPLPEEIHNIRRRIFNRSQKRPNIVPVGSDSHEQTLNMLGNPERAISRHKPYGKVSETIKGHLETDGGIVRAAWEHTEVGRNDQLAEMRNNTDTDKT